jgi:hypothetical protein
MKRLNSRRQNRSTGKSTSATPAQTPGAPARVELHIQELVLHGFPSGDRFAISDAAQQELERLLSEQSPVGIAHGPMHVERVNAGSFNVMPEAKGPRIGRNLAQAIHRGLSFNPARRDVTSKKL